MQAPRIRLTVDRFWYATICMWAAIGLLNASSDHIEKAHHTFGWEIWWAIFDGLFGAVAMCVAVYHMCGLLRWVGLRLIAIAERFRTETLR